MPPKSKEAAGGGGGGAAAATTKSGKGAAADAGVQAGRNTSFHTRTFTSEESNFFLFRTVFLYVFFGFEGIETMFPRGGTTITINTLLNKTGIITDDEVKKMIWVVCMLETFLNNSQDGETAVFFISKLNDAYIQTRGIYPIPDIAVIAKSIATLVIRVFIAFQNRINGLNPAAVAAVEAEMKRVVTDAVTTVTSEIDNPINNIPEILKELIKDPTAEDDDVKKNATQKKSELDRKILNIIPQEVAEGEAAVAASSRRVSDRVKASNQAIAAAAAARDAAKEQQKQAEDVKKQAIIAKELAQLRECMASFGKLTKFIPSIPVSCLSSSDNPAEFTFDVPKFYKSLPLAFSRIRSCIERRLTHEDVKPGPGTADTMNSLGLPDPSVKTMDDDDVPSGGARRIGITKRKKNNKIIVKLKSKFKKHSQKIFYGGADGVMLRGFGEHTQPIPQCDSTIDNYHKYTNPSCYICGEPWIEGLQSSMECEHILCVIHAIEYYGLLQTVFLDPAQKEFLSNLYAWAHRCCNQRKRNTAFIRKNPTPAAARGNHFIPDDMNIRELLADIHTLSKYPDTDPKHKLDCNKILKQGKYRDKKHFVDARTIVVTKYVSPLIDSINTVFTGLFQASMVLFNAVGCLKILSEFTIYLTGSKKSPSLQLQLGKTAEFMDEVVFTNCRVDAAAGGMRAGGGRRIFHDKTRKSLRRKIQRGGAKNFITDFFTGLVAQEEYETEIRNFKDEISIRIPQDREDNTLNSYLNQLRDPSPPVNRFGTLLTQEVDPTKMDAILFILFILNHSRNPTILLGLFLDLNLGNYISSEIAQYPDEEEPSNQGDLTSDAVSHNLAESKRIYDAKRISNQTAFIEIFTRVVNNDNLFNSVIIPYLTSCNMLPSFLGVITFCRRQEFITTDIPQLGSKLDVITRDLFGKVQSSLPDVDAFAAKVIGFKEHLHKNQILFASEVAIPNTPLDHLVNACVHLKQFSDNTAGVLLEACCLFPSCFDPEADIFSKFGPCNAYPDVLPEPNFQQMLGCVASAKEMCTIIAVGGGLSQHVRSLHGEPSQEQKLALDLFIDYFDEEDKSILSPVATQVFPAFSVASPAAATALAPAPAPALAPALAPAPAPAPAPALDAMMRRYYNPISLISGPIDQDPDIRPVDPDDERRRLDLQNKLEEVKYNLSAAAAGVNVVGAGTPVKYPIPNSGPPNQMRFGTPPPSGSLGIWPNSPDSFSSVGSGFGNFSPGSSPGSPVSSGSPGSSLSPARPWQGALNWRNWFNRHGGSSTRRHRRLHRNHRRTQYTNKHKRSSKTTKHSTIKHRKSYRKHNRTIKRRKSRRHH